MLIYSDLLFHSAAFRCLNRTVYNNQWRRQETGVTNSSHRSRLRLFISAEVCVCCLFGRYYLYVVTNQ